MEMSVRALSDDFHLSVLLSDHLPLRTGIPREISPMEVPREWGHPATHPTDTAPAATLRARVLFNATFIPETTEVLPLLGAH